MLIFYNAASFKTKKTARFWQPSSSFIINLNDKNYSALLAPAFAGVTLIFFVMNPERRH